jgi:hypothetical protein
MSRGCMSDLRFVYYMALLSCALAIGCNDSTPVTPPTTAIKAPRVDAPPAAEDRNQPAKPQNGYGPGAELAPQPSANELFAGWKKPQLLLVISGEQMATSSPAVVPAWRTRKGAWPAAIR